MTTETTVQTTPGNSASGEELFTVAQVAARLKLSESHVRRIFQDMPGVIAIPSLRRSRGKRDYVTLRIPATLVSNWLSAHTRRTYGGPVKV